MPVCPADRPVQVLNITIDAYIANCDLQYQPLSWFNFWSVDYDANKQDALNFSQALNEQKGELLCVGDMINFIAQYHCQQNDFKQFLPKALRQACGFTNIFIEKYVEHYKRINKYLSLPISEGSSPYACDYAYEEIKNALKSKTKYNEFVSDLQDNCPELYSIIQNYILFSYDDPAFFEKTNKAFLSKYLSKLLEKDINILFDSHKKAPPESLQTGPSYRNC